MADIPTSPPLNITSQQNSSVNSARKITNQQVGSIAENMGSQSDDLVTALEAIAAAINAKPSA